MKIAVLGGSGFVGSNLTKELEGRGHCVQALSRPLFDLQQPDSFKNIDPTVEAVVQAAGVVGAGYCARETWLTNVKGAYDLAAFLKEMPSLKYFLYISSGAVYAYCEEAKNVNSAIEPIGDYGMGKFLGEVISSKTLFCKTANARLFFPYGPGQSADRFIPKLFKRVIAGEPIDLKGSEGQPLLNPIYIDDLSSSLAGMVESQKQGSVNIGGGITTLKEIVGIMGKLTQKKPVFRTEESLPASLYCEDSINDIELIRLEDGLLRVLAGLENT